MKKFVFALMAVLALSVFSIAACQKTETQTNQPAPQKMPILNPEGRASDSGANLEIPEQEQATAKQETETQQPAPQPLPQELPKETIKEFSINAFKFSYSPSTIEVNKGDKVKITLTSSDATHGFSISEYGISETISPGETKTVEFTADKAGTFAFFCTVYCGSGHGSMRGNLIVR